MDTILLNIQSNFLIILEILLVFLTLVGGGIYFIISKNITRKIEKLLEEERAAARAEGFTTKAYPLWILYYKYKEKVFLDEALIAVRMAEESARTIHRDHLMDVAYSAKNAWAYYLAEKEHNKKGSVDEFDKERALGIKDELWKLISSGYTPRYGSLSARTLTQWKETCAWVMYCFAKDQDTETKEKAKKIIKDLEKEISPDDFEELKKLYSIV